MRWDRPTVVDEAKEISAQKKEKSNIPKDKMDAIKKRLAQLGYMG